MVKAFLNMLNGIKTSEIKGTCNKTQKVSIWFENTLIKFKVLLVEGTNASFEHA